MTMKKMRVRRHLKNLRGLRGLSVWHAVYRWQFMGNQVQELSEKDIVKDNNNNNNNNNNNTNKIMDMEIKDKVTREGE